MFTLVIGRSRYLRIRRGVTKREVENAFAFPYNGEIFCGSIIELPEKPYKIYRVEAGETYASVARRTGVDEQELKNFNGDRAVYPTVKIFLP